MLLLQGEFLVGFPQSLVGELEPPKPHRAAKKPPKLKENDHLSLKKSIN